LTLALLDADLALIRAAFVRGDVGDARDYAHRLAGKLKAAHRTVTPAESNYVGIPDEAIRRVVDPPFVALAASLDVAYYQHWKRGLSHPWHGYDVQPTPEESKAQFDKLNGLIWHEYAVALDDADQLQDVEDRIPDRRKVGDADGRTKRQVAEDWMAKEGLRLPVSALPAKVKRGDLVTARDVVRARPR